jgi:hypothetical protein
MWEGFVGQTIASTSKTLRTIGKILAFLALAILLYRSKTIINLAAGPAHFGEDQLVTLSNSNARLRNYITVRGRDTDTTGIESIQKSTRNGVVESERVTAEYMVMIVGKHLLVVKAKPKEQADSYLGRIVALPDDLKKRLFSGLQDSRSIEEATFPVMLDASEEYADSDFWSSVTVALLFVIGAMWLFYLYKKRTDSPETHPLERMISKYGPIFSLVPQIDAEVAAGSSYLLGVRMTENWLISCTVAKSIVMRRDELLWVYRKRTKHSVNLIPTGTSYSAVLRDSRGKTLEISATNEEQTEGFLSTIVCRTPGVIVGYDKKLDKLYRKDRLEFSTMVSQRKAALASGVPLKHSDGAW